MTQSAVGIDVGSRVIILGDLEQQLNAGGVATPNGLTIIGPPYPTPPPPTPALYVPLPDGSRLFTYDSAGNMVDLPPEAEPIVAAYTPNQAST
jgi:hypothetical protein